MSESYRALTRAYRPQTFDDVVSQEHVRDTLQNAIRNDRISHAYMFCGPRGVGKTTMARVLARAVNGVGEDLDGEDLTRTLNIIEMDAASNRRIEDIRSLKEVIRVPPQNGRFKIFIIDEVHMLTKEAFNALLKTLEEPPDHAIFIFATTEPHKVLPTILSRVQRFDFKRIGVRDIVDRLRSICEKESIEVDEESLHLIARKADGALRDALGMMDQAVAFCGRTVHYEELLTALNLVGTRELFELVRLILEKDSEGSLRMVQRLVHNGVDIQEFLVSLTEHLRNLYVATHPGRLGLIEASDEMHRMYAEQAKALSEEDWMRMLHLVSQTQAMLRDARQPVIQFEILMLKLIHMGRAQEIETLIDEIRELKKKEIESIANPEEETPRSQEEDQTSNSKDADKEPAEPDVSPTREPRSSEKSNQPDGSDVDSENLFGRPSLVSASNRSGSEVDEPVGESQSGQTESRNGSGQSDPHDEKNLPEGSSRQLSRDEELKVERSPVDHHPLKIEEVVGKWDRLLELAEKEAPRMLYFQLQRIQCHELTGNQLEVEVENEFASRLLEENQKLLSELFARVLGRTIRIHGTITTSKEPKRERMSPYERFQEIQKKDPTLKKIVELFGAELEY